MKQVITAPDQVLGTWLAARTNGAYVEGQARHVGLVDETGEIQAVAGYQAYNGASIMMHCAGLAKRWLNKEFLWFAFYYPFEQLQVKKIISPVESTNADCIRFIQHLGFQLEATLKDAAPNGDLLIFSLVRDGCKWLTLKRSNNDGQAESA